MPTPNSSSNEVVAISSEGRRFALVVGVNNSTKSTYLKPLLYAERDAHAIADVLRKPECNFAVLEPPLVGKEASTWAIMHAVTELIDKGTSQDFLLFYFSGHAKRMHIGENQEDVYFVTHDFEEAKIKVMPDLHLSMSWLWKAFFQRAEAGRALLMLDCCYAGKMVGAGSNLYQVDIRQIVEDYLNASKLKGHQDRLRLILMATRDDATALELDGHGLMTRLVLRALRGEGKEVLDDEGRVDVASLAEYLTKEMQVQPPHLWVEGTSKPCILAHYPKQSARSLREAAQAREDALMTVLSDLRDQITDRYFFNRLNPHQPFDQIRCETASVTDLNQEKVTEFFKRDRVQIQEDFYRGASDQDQLRHFELLEEAHPTYGALLCFGLKPTKWLAGAFTRCTLWNGDARHSGWLDAQDYRGDLIKQFESSRDFLRKCLRLPRVIGKEERSEEPEIPVVALEEVLANALVHREYANQTSPVYIDVFDDRIEISNPGVPPEPMTLELLKEEHKSYPRNPQIARLFYLYGYVETVGSGIQRMQHALERAGLPPANFELGKDRTFKVIFYRSKHRLLEEHVDVFISYSHADEAFVERLKADLHDQGIATLMKPGGMQPGTPDWEDTLRTAIRAAADVLLIVSPDARGSRSVKDELRLAEMYQRPVYAVWVAGTQWRDTAPMGWGEMQYIDAREERYEQALREIVAVLSTTSSTPERIIPTLQIPEPRNPYKGLRAFTKDDATDFFGRDVLIDELTGALGETLASAEANTQHARFLAVVGPSGAGKSSVIMAGLLPRLQAGALPESEEWVYLEPIVPGGHPIEALTLTLASRLPDRSLKTILEDLENASVRGLHLLANALAKGSGSKVVLVVDQFEEVFTRTVSEDERQHFIDLLVTAVTEPRGPAIVILSLRADFYDRPMSYAELGRLIQKHQSLVVPMNIKDLRSVIERPAALPDVQVSFEDDLVSDLLFEVKGQAGTLPLLQFMLDQLFQRRTGHLLTLQAYNETGGVKGALARHAESTYASLPSDEHRGLVRALFLRLIDPGMTEQDTTRRRASLSEFSFPDTTTTRLLQEVADAFIAARLLTTSEIAGMITIEVSNEALIREWARLSAWLRVARDDIRLLQIIREDVVEWERRGKPRDHLYRGSRLKEANGWAKRTLLSRGEEAFLRASDLQRARALISVIVVGLLLLSTSGVAGWLFLLLPPNPTHVTTLNDSGPGSLRQAIAIAPAGSTITFDASLAGTILLTSGDLIFTKSLALRGPGAGILRISSNSRSYGILVIPSVSVSISSLAFMNSTIKSTSPGSFASFITNNGTLILTNSIVSGNRASGNFSLGGGITNNGTLTLIHSTVSGNTASNSGGGIYNTGTLTLTNSTVSGNTASNSGGGIYNTGTLTLTNSTVSGNHAHIEPDILDHRITPTTWVPADLMSVSKSMA